MFIVAAARETIKQINSRPVRRNGVGFSITAPENDNSAARNGRPFTRPLPSPLYAFRSPRRAIRSDFYCALEKSPFPADYIRPRHVVITGYDIIRYIAVVPVSLNIRETAAQTDSAVFDVPPPRTGPDVSGGERKRTAF